LVVGASMTALPAYSGLDVRKRAAGSFWRAERSSAVNLCSLNVVHNPISVFLAGVVGVHASPIHNEFLKLESEEM
jgi:hypothetical protein